MRAQSLRAPRRGIRQMMPERIGEALVRFALRLVARGLFRIRVVGYENIPCRGPALLVANHVTFLDGFIIGFFFPTVVRFLVWRPYYRLRLFNWALRLAYSIPVGTGPHDLADCIRRARYELEKGEIVCIFPEGFITRTGNLLPVKRGLEKIIHGLNVPIIPIHLDGLWGSIFSFGGRGVFWKWPRHLRQPVTVSFGAPMPASSTANDVRQAIQDLDAGIDAGEVLADRPG
jgi:acyl-[acyl-carrier-protein]-phospholipid O-acyltransferase / long-chain-fatty-acid--[acyl-carrier-protein] ligase